MGQITGTMQRGISTIMTPSSKILLHHSETITPDEEIGSLSSQATLKFEKSVLREHQAKPQEIQKERAESDERERQTKKIRR